MIVVRRVGTPNEWDACKAIRFEVFVDEQAVPAELELDAHDRTARHWLVLDEGEAVGTARVIELPDAWKVGRVAVRARHRGLGIGLRLMRAILDEARLEGASQLVLESQVHAMPFYAKLGYVAEGPEFLDAGIPHRKMRLKLSPATP